MHPIRRFASILTVVLIFPVAALAQGTADIVGRVTDTSGGVLPAVTVTAENAATKISRTTVTSDTGDYTFTLLPIGSYSVKIELSGFQTVNARVDLATGDRARVDARMQLGTVAETVMVTGDAPLLQTDTSTVGALGGVINSLTKAGSNQFHGSAFEFGRHDKFDSRLFFARDKPIMRQNQYGGSLGGPIKANKTFFFVDYEGYRLKQGVPTVVT